MLKPAPTQMVIVTESERNYDNSYNLDRAQKIVSELEEDEISKKLVLKEF